MCGGMVAFGKVSVGTLGVQQRLTQHHCLMFTFIYLPTIICGPNTGRVAE
jgi:hypothetical protein